ncbi:TetR/AcrR family transcriptional regulator [Pontivivens ytuae]|uniref:TetR/AcrR family transcriptional regulator n=1 Tax=Pontivivens ytuae TaxID=2789856 RepID=A0A7S9LSD9_9RHOB|nr:TetR/AcrR family transcriptional regulator [Pontivivens ytuae]QPH54434.1 TetR/AcrR family transcriptional regulator [Pontivivens ytuae]
MSSQIGEPERPKRGRPRRFDVESALDAMTDLFWRQGYGATSLDDLVAASGASRASLYGVWGDKDALFAAALGRYAERFTRRVDAALAETPDRRAALARILNESADRLADGDRPPGCLRCRAMLELRGRPTLDAALDAAEAAFRTDAARLLGTAPEDGAVAFFTAIVDGMVVLAEAGADRATLDAVLTRALDQLAPLASPAPAR